MSLLAFPSTLPQPRRARHAGANRVQASDLPGKSAYASRERDYTGTLELEFFFDSTASATFYTFWKDTILKGGYSFNASWPALKAGGLVVKLITEPSFKHVYDGAYVVSFTAEVRGASLPVQFASDPYFANVTLLLHGDDAAPTIFTDSSQYHRTATVVGAIVNAADSTAFGLRSISSFVGASANYLSYSYAIAAANEPFTCEIRYKILQQTGIGDGYSEGRGEFFRLALGATQVASANGFINSASEHLFTQPNAFSVPWASYGMLSGADRVYACWSREAGNILSFYFNGYYQGASAYAGAIDTVTIGNRGVNSRTATVQIEEIRITTGVARVLRTSTNIGSRQTSVPVLPFPNSA